MKLGIFDTNNWYSVEYKKRDGNTPDNVHAIPDNIPANLAFWNGTAVIEKTQAERDTYDQAQAELAETARQAAKPEKLKQAENDFLTLIASIPAEAGIVPGDDAAGIKVKLLVYYSDDKTTALEIAVNLLSAVHEVEINGGSWFDLPGQLHII